MSGPATINKIIGQRANPLVHRHHPLVVRASSPRPPSSTTDRYSLIHSFFNNMSRPSNIKTDRYLIPSGDRPRGYLSTLDSSSPLRRRLSTNAKNVSYLKSSIPSSVHSRAFSTSRRKFQKKGVEDSYPSSDYTAPKTEGKDFSSSPTSTSDPVPHPATTLLSTYPSSIRNYVIAHLPHRISRPTLEDLLDLPHSTSFQRLGFRWKWFTIRGFRRYNTDDVSAFLSWFLVGNTFWLVLGTTGFVSMVILTASGFGGSDFIASALSKYMTKSSGVTVIFESAISPNVFGSMIRLNNVFISRRPTEEAVEMGDVNYTMFDLNVDCIDVKLSFWSWLNGDGFIKEASVKGVRGAVDRRNVTWDPLNPWIPSEWRHPSIPGADFILDHLSVEDFLVTVYQPGGFRPYNVSVFNAEFKCFRKMWLFYDVISAESITGQYDNCLFSLHKPQRVGKTMGGDAKDGTSPRMARIRIDALPIDHLQGSTSTGPLAWITAGKVDIVLDISFPRHPDDDDMDFSGLVKEIIENVQGGDGGRGDVNPGTKGLSRGALSVPTKEMELEFGETRSTRNIINNIRNNNLIFKPPVTDRLEIITSPTSAPTVITSPPNITSTEDLFEESFKSSSEGDEEDEESLESKLKARKVTVDVDLRFRDLKAQVPYLDNQLGYVNGALIRPIVAFINANRTLIPIQCKVTQDLSEFEGSWTPFETGLLDKTSEQVYEALAYHVSSEAANRQRFKAVGVWSLQMSAQAFLSAVKTAVQKDLANVSSSGVMMMG